jgi:protein-L-isoaspartate(D-aspartate) O-methyltransferase
LLASIVMDRNQLLYHLEHNTNVLNNPLIKSAFETVDRKDFVRGDYEMEAYEDCALPIGCGQSISQPTTVAYMLELLNSQEGDRILDVGSGSGWTTALLSHIVGVDGRVFGLELIPELVEAGKKNLTKYALPHASIEQVPLKIGLKGDIGMYSPAEIGLEREAPFDKILVSAAAEELPVELVEQLEEGGTMVIPIRDSISKFVKNVDGSLSQENHRGFVFVPFKGL